jgi:hypothetical protein
MHRFYILKAAGEGGVTVRVPTLLSNVPDLPINAGGLIPLVGVGQSGSAFLLMAVQANWLRKVRRI